MILERRRRKRQQQSSAGSTLLQLHASKCCRALAHRAASSRQPVCSGSNARHIQQRSSRRTHQQAPAAGADARCVRACARVQHRAARCSTDGRAPVVHISCGSCSAAHSGASEAGWLARLARLLGAASGAPRSVTVATQRANARRRNQVGLRTRRRPLRGARAAWLGSGERGPTLPPLTRGEAAASVPPPPRRRLEAHVAASARHSGSGAARGSLAARGAHSSRIPNPETSGFFEPAKRRAHCA